MGVDLYTGSTYTPENTVHVLFIFLIKVEMIEEWYSFMNN